MQRPKLNDVVAVYHVLTLEHYAYMGSGKKVITNTVKK